MNSNQKGAIVEAAIAYQAVLAGVEVFTPASEHSRADLIFGIGSELFRVQCKSARRTEEVLVVTLAGSRHTPGGYVRSKYSAEEVDLVAAHCIELGRSFLLPFDVAAEGKSVLHLRLSPPKNGQRAAIHYASEYEFPGAVAQLGERCRGTAEATGSSPVSSTPSADTDQNVVGAHRFRNHFGYYMERAVAGEEILITRRGRRYARLGPADPVLSVGE